MGHDVEEGDAFKLNFSKLATTVAKAGNSHVVPVCVQDAATREVLILAFANELALNEARKQRVCVLWSTSRNQLWIKGASSGDYLDLVDILINCEQNSLVYLVRPRRLGACHTRDAASGATRKSCYYRALAPTFDAEASLERTTLDFRFAPAPGALAKTNLALVFAAGALLGFCVARATTRST